MNRRQFLRAAAPALATPLLAPALASPSPRSIWTVRLLPPRPWEPPGWGKLVDAATGADVSRRFPLRLCRRLYRARASGQPIRVALFKLDAHGKPYLDGDRIATEAAWVRVLA